MNNILPTPIEKIFIKWLESLEDDCYLDEDLVEKLLLKIVKYYEITKKYRV